MTAIAYNNTMRGIVRKVGNMYWFVGLLFAVVILIDASQRAMLPVGWLYVILSVILWPVIAPLYFAKRHLKAGEMRIGGTFWHWTRYFLAFWTIGMIFLAIGSILQIGNSGAGAGSSILAAGMGTGIVCVVWIVPLLVLLVLGSLLKNDNIEEGPTGPLANR